MIQKISLFLPKVNFKGNSNVKITSNRFEKTPDVDEVTISKKKLTGEEQFKEIMDNKVFTFAKSDGSEFVGTIKEYFENSIIDWSEKAMSTPRGGVIHSTYWECAKDILENGLDADKASRVQAGPGAYFAAFQDMNYGKIAVSGRYTGSQKELPAFEKRFYDGIMGNSEILAIAKDFSDENQDAYKLVNRYCRDLLKNEMGIDILYCAMGMNSCYVALDDSKMHVEPYNFRVKYEGGEMKFDGYC